MKKIFAIAASLIMLIGLVSCGDTTPTDALSADLDEIKAEEIDDKMVAEAFGADGKELTKQYGKKFKGFLEKMQEFEYEVKDEKISDDGNSAVVKVEIKAYDFGSAFEKTMDRVINDATTGKITANDDIEAYVFGVFFDETNKVDKKVTNVVEINCTKDDDDEWETDIDDNEKLTDAVLGNMMSVAGSEGN